MRKPECRIAEPNLGSEKFGKASPTARLAIRSTNTSLPGAIDVRVALAQNWVHTFTRNESTLGAFSASVINLVMQYKFEAYIVFNTQPLPYCKNIT